jgi:proteic killer suppression protein
MIAGFQYKGLKRLHEQGDASKIRPGLIETVENILAVPDQAEDLQDIAIPRYRLHALKGDRKGYWAVTVKANWRIIFRFEKGRVGDVELLDYH